MPAYPNIGVSQQHSLVTTVILVHEQRRDIKTLEEGSGITFLGVCNFDHFSVGCFLYFFTHKQCCLFGGAAALPLSHGNGATFSS